MSKKKIVKVSVAYGWQKFDSDNDPRVGNDSKDIFWKSIKAYLQPTADSVAESAGVRVEIVKLAPGIEDNMLDGIINRIRKSDVVVLDLASPTKPVKKRKVDSKTILTEINRNVLFELGLAMGMEKSVIVMCHRHLHNMLPSDTGGRFVFFYHGKLDQNEFARIFVEGNKLRAIFRDMLIKSLPVSARRRMKLRTKKSVTTDNVNGLEVVK